MIEVVKYQINNRKEWNDFMPFAKNGHFMFYRDYMEYHSERFTDYSLMFYDNNKLLAVMPASVKNNIVNSHGGLTFGGIISALQMSTNKMVEIFEKLVSFLREEKIEEIVYKTVPAIYHIFPSDEDLYALFINNAELYRRDVSSTILFENKGKYSKGRKSAVKQAIKNGLYVLQSSDFDVFMEIEQKLLNNKFGVNPAHSGQEMTMLAQRFPGNIKLFMAFLEDKPLGGTIIYENKLTAHCQYISTTDEGKELGAVDITLDYLLTEYYKDMKYFDFGISTENEGKYLNQNLIRNKESFGASATVYDFYKLKL